MDPYISAFINTMGNCVVKDYAVYLQKLTGLARFNPFAVSEQLVVYVTDRGCFCCRVQNMGEFTSPVSLQQARLQFSADGRKVSGIDNGRAYTFVRKCKNGVYASRDAFAAAVRHKA